jgi:4-amino-4-deoxy-L-arabinose transferase-like glycosyltransferase
VYTASIFLTGRIFIRFSSSPALGIVASLLMVVFPTSLRMAGSAMSEPLFILILALSFYCLLEYFRNQINAWLVFSGVVASLLPMTRYIGVVIIPAGVLGIFLFLQGTWKKRLTRAVVFGILASLPLLIWQGWIYFFVDQSLAGRTLSLEAGAMSARFIQFYSGVTQLVLSWVPFFGGAIWNLPFRYRYGLIFLVAVGIFVATVLAARRAAKDAARSKIDSCIWIAGLAGLWLVTYLGFLAVDGLIVIPIPPITNRILLPVFFGLLVGLLGVCDIWQTAWLQRKWHWIKAMPWVLALGALIGYYPITLNEVLVPYHQGVGMTAYSWRDSETMAAVRALPPGTVIVTNDSYTLWVWADRTAYSLVETLDPYFLGQGSSYGALLSDPSQYAFRNGAALVIFEDEFAKQMESSYGEAGTKRLETLFNGLIIGGSYADGKIYYYPK